MKNYNIHIFLNCQFVFIIYFLFDLVFIFCIKTLSKNVLIIQIKRKGKENKRQKVVNYCFGFF